MPNIFVISDGTGKTAEQALEAALVQFDRSRVEIETFSEVRTYDRVHEVVEEAAEANAFIVHTLVTDKLREELIRYGRQMNVETIDLMGPLLQRLSDHLATDPTGRPGLFRELNDSYFRRVETMQFAFNHDDGKRVEDLRKAEIVLVGVSRTFKTPLSIYLAFKRWYVANIPIVLDMPVPDPLYDFPPERVFCLTTYPNRLAILRRARQERFGGSTGEYANPDYVKKELRYAMRVFDSQPGWQRINVTSKSIEEIAAEIVALLPKKEQNAPNHDPA